MTDNLLARFAASDVTEMLQAFPVVIVTGMRQSGKSTLTRMLSTGRSQTYWTLDDPAILERAKHEPDALMNIDGPIVLDEVQRAPELLLAVKRAVDRDRTPGKFILTGSANLLLMQKITESLAGRAVFLTLSPLTRREQFGMGESGVWEKLWNANDKDWPAILKNETAPSEPWRGFAKRGGMPVPAYHLTNDNARARWFEGYLQSYVERDLRELSAVSSLVDFRRLMRAAMLRIGSLMNQTEIGRDLQMSQSTVYRYLSLLEISYFLFRLPAFATNRTKRLIKASKIYATDTGVALHLSGETEPRGAHLENLVVSDLMAWREVHADRPEITYWRTASGDEVDFVIDWRKQQLPIEVKSADRVTLADAKTLKVFREEYNKTARAGLLLYGGDEIFWLADGVLAAPWWRVM